MVVVVVGFWGLLLLDWEGSSKLLGRNCKSEEEEGNWLLVVSQPDGVVVSGVVVVVSDVFHPCKELSQPPPLLSVVVCCGVPQAESSSGPKERKRISHVFVVCVVWCVGEGDETCLIFRKTRKRQW